MEIHFVTRMVNGFEDRAHGGAVKQLEKRPNGDDEFDRRKKQQLRPLIATASRRIDDGLPKPTTDAKTPLPMTKESQSAKLPDEEESR